jgi:hypothetical protein
VVAAALALGEALGSLTIPPPGQTVTGTTAAWWIARVAIILVASGGVAGIFLRADGRYREVALGGYAVGWVVTYIVFTVWVDMHTSPTDCTRANPCDTPAETLGAIIFAAMAAVVVMLGALGGRLARRRLRRSPV